MNRFGHRLRPPSPDALAPPDLDQTDHPPDPAAEDPPTAYRPPTGEAARWRDIEVLSDRELVDTFTPRLHVIGDAASRPEPEAAVFVRDPFDAYRRWDESG